MAENSHARPYDAVAVGENVAPAGEDVEAGEHLFDTGRRLRPSDLALLRASGAGTVEVHEPPRVSVLPTGEEVVDAAPEPGEVVETNGMMVADVVDRCGALLVHGVAIKPGHPVGAGVISTTGRANHARVDTRH